MQALELTHPQSSEPSSDLVHRLQQLEGSTQAALATLRRSLVENVRPTRERLAHEAAIAFQVRDHEQALAMIDEVAQTVGISGLG